MVSIGGMIIALMAQMGEDVSKRSVHFDLLNCVFMCVFMYV